ncbi:MAG TPA: FAD-dependent oxidoreductase [Spirochaetota bacterium]|nr:FAD-dependent oxidoreductase [Spirochaetota bacterium]HPI89190.1 FAD-dependent oxidoreductase [Spirochaetota bacterium]HPR46815.1 FAD-dependent oxidoreductase [Spirochaetota bacterium]
MSVKKIVIAGLGSAGYAALMAVKRADPSGEITVVDPKGSDLRHPCGMPYSLEGIVDPAHLESDINLDRMNVNRVRAVLTGIDAQKKTILCSGEGKEHLLDYDALILCTGSRALLPPIKGVDCFFSRGLYTLADLDDLRHIRAAAETSKRAVVVGAGAIGMETAYALRTQGKEVVLLEMKPQVLPGVLDPDLSSIAEKYLADSGISLLKNRTAREITGREGFAGIMTDEGEITADFGIIAAGFTPNCEAAFASDISGDRRGISVNERMETSQKDIFAAGDCIATWSVIDGQSIPAKLATSAYKQGTVAGINAAGGRAAYRGSSGTFVTRIGELEIAGTGFTTEVAAGRGFEPVSGKIRSAVLPEYFPGNTDISVKIIADRASGRILGAQAIGQGAAARINIVSTAIEFNISCADFDRIEMAYCPAVSEVYDPLLRAADFCMRRLKR